MCGSARNIDDTEQAPCKAIDMIDMIDMIDTVTVSIVMLGIVFVGAVVSLWD